MSNRKYGLIGSSVIFPDKIHFISKQFVTFIHFIKVQLLC